MTTVDVHVFGMRFRPYLMSVLILLMKFLGKLFCLRRISLMFDISSSFPCSSVIRECARLRRLETTEVFALMGCDDLKSKHMLLEWVFFLNMDTLKSPVFLSLN
uniref:Uncharacterized protein n=1 Tax=Trichobilharzia regenti TaxID=157069 RepID=A0AA85JFN4_TRIRE|nr:unnamed protein product [Trichobilharzia regenti]